MKIITLQYFFGTEHFGFYLYDFKSIYYAMKYAFAKEGGRQLVIFTLNNGNKY
jgi:hypothetical protein